MQVPSVALAAILALASGSAASEQLDSNAYPRLLKAYMVSKAAQEVVKICSADDTAHTVNYAGAWFDWYARTPGVGFLMKASPEVDRVGEDVVAEFKRQTPEQRKSGCANFLRSFQETEAMCGPPAKPVIRSQADIADLQAVLAGFTASEDHDVITRDNPATHYRTYAALFVDVDYAGWVENVSFQRSTGNRKVDKALAAWVREMRFVPEDCEFKRTRRGVLPIDLRGGATPGAWVTGGNP